MNTFTPAEINMSESDIQMGPEDSVPNEVVISPIDIATQALESFSSLRSSESTETIDAEVCGLLKEFAGAELVDAGDTNSQYINRDTGTTFRVASGTSNYVTAFSMSADNPDWSLPSDRGTINFHRLLIVEVDEKMDAQAGSTLPGYTTITYQEVPENRKYSAGTEATYN